MNWKRIEPTKTEHFGFRTIVTKNYHLPDGQTHQFQTTNPEGTKFSGCIALTKDNQIIIARQFRPGPELVMDEIPGGLVEEGEDLEAAASRELREETGYIPGAMKKIGFAYKDAYNNATWHYYLATDCELHPEGQELDDLEFIETKLISIEELFDNAKNAKMTDVAAVHLAYDVLEELRLKRDNK